MAPPIPFNPPTVSPPHRRLPTALRGLLGHGPALRASARGLWTWLAAGPWAGLRSVRQAVQWGALALVLLMLLFGQPAQRAGQPTRRPRSPRPPPRPLWDGWLPGPPHHG